MTETKNLKLKTYETTTDGQELVARYIDNTSDNFQKIDEFCKTDTTLSVEGCIADAKTVGDNVSKLKEDLANVEENIYVVLQSRNRLNFETMTDGYYVNYTTGEVAGNGTLGFSYSEFIYVGDCDSVVLSRSSGAGIGAIHSYFYSAPNFESKVDGHLFGTDSPSCEVPSGAKYIIISTGKDSKSDYQLEKGTVATGFTYYYHKVLTKSERSIDLYYNGTDHLMKWIRVAEDIASDSIAVNFHIPSGSYNLLEYFNDSEKSASNFIGLKVPNNVNLIGNSKEDTILYISLSTVSEKISTLNMLGTSGLKNLTVRATKGRYAVHDDFATKAYTTYKDYYYRNVENCNFEVVDCKYGCYGAGTRGGAIWHLKNCLFDGGFSWHSWSSDETSDVLNSTIANDITLENCINKTDGINGMVLKSLGSGVNNKIHLIGCEIPLISCTEETSGLGFDFVVDGYGNNEIPFRIVTTKANEKTPFALSDCTAYLRFAQDITNAKPLFKNGYNAYALGGRSPYRMTGIALESNTSGQWSTILTKGYYMASLLGIDGLEDGTLVTVSGGNLAQATDDSVVIGTIETMWNTKFLHLIN